MSDELPDELQELRRILFEPEQEKLSVIEKRLDDPVVQAEDLSRVLPRAFARSAKRDPALARAMIPAVEVALKESVRRNPAVLTDAVFPLIGPAIRRALADSFGRMLQSFNQAMEHSLSWRGLSWRIEAKRTGRSFGEVVLMHTLIFRVEQVFLIHQPSGLLLQHVTASEIESSDEDVISGMLTAINSFVRDSFRSGGGDDLAAVRVGDLDVWMEAGPNATLAAVIRGHAPSSLRNTMVDTLESIHRDEPVLLKNFDGDGDLFLPVRPRLEECLQTQLTEKARRKKKASPQLVILAAVAVASLVAWGVIAGRANSLWKDYVATLRAEPGLVVTNVEKRSGEYRLAGLKDAMARDPAAIAAGMGLDTTKLQFNWEPFIALNPSMILRRAEARLSPPPEVELDLNDGILFVRGVASEDWWRGVEDTANMLPGVDQVDFTGLFWEINTSHLQ